MASRNQHSANPSIEMSLAMRNVNKCIFKSNASKVTVRLLQGAAIATLMMGSALAQDVVTCDPEVCPPKSGAGQTISIPLGDNTELAASDLDTDDLGISISVDGERVLGKPVTADAQRKADVGLDSMDVQVKFDGLEVKPVLNVSTQDVKRAYKSGETVTFVSSTNYGSWVESAEVRVYERGTLGDGKPLAVVPIQAVGNATWQVPADGPADYEYVLRVYDTEKRFDETKPLTIARTSSDFAKHDTAPQEDAVAPGNGDDRTAFRNIPVYGGAVTIYGDNVPAGYKVDALGETIPVDSENKFVVQRILPPGDHQVDVAVNGGKSEGVSFSREVNIPSNDWFYVAIADLTVGKRFGSAKVIDANPSEYDRVYTKGRLAFYLKGKIQGKYLLTASADTGEDDVRNLFKGLDAKNPRQLLRRIDPNKYYPVYGDDSTSIEDAPTSGKFYVRLERGDSHVMWGNFRTSINGGQYLRNERTLYGASGVYKSEKTTSFGARQVEVQAYAAQPGTLPQRDILRGTGGSAYFLKRQDISTGSETVTIEIRDTVTGQVTSRRVLQYGKDYTINYTQGVIILTRPLNSTASGDSVVRDTSLGDNAVNLVVQYEYTPIVSDVDGYSYGGRAQAWLADKVRVGVTGMNEETGTGVVSSDQRMVGADITIRHSDTTYLEAEYAQTRGPGFGRSLSSDGGLTIGDEGSSGVAGVKAEAYRVKGQLDLADVSGGSVKGKIGAYYDRKERGFSTLDDPIDVDQRIIGAFAEFEPTEKIKVKLGYEDFKDANAKRRAEATADVVVQLDDYWEATIGVKYSDLNSPTGLAKENGSRTDIGAKLAYAPDDDQKYYVFGQATVDRSGGRLRNDRIGVGAEKQLTEKVGVIGEVSYGTTGVGALAAITYEPTADDSYHIGYRLDPDRSRDGSNLSGSDRGSIVAGAKRRYNEVLTGFAENNYDMFGKRRSLTSTYGVTYTPDALWTVDGGLEIGDVQDVTGDFSRRAISLGASYNNKDAFTARMRGEARFDNSDDNSKDVKSYLVSAGVSWQTNPDWRLVADIDAVFSSANSDIRDGDYIEGSIGYAYRPVENDKVNALFKYVFLHDLPGPDQVTVNNSTLGPRQTSHIVSADVNYQVNDYLELGAKYGYRFGESETVRGSGIYTPNNVHLGVLRADIAVIKNWDALVEGRVLYSSSAKTTQYGALAAVYRHFGNNVKAGVGYNFGSFSDDLRDLTYDDRGVFVNVIGKF
jgi:hypothetical protein